MTNENYYCIIMAGGIGSRFWPISRTQKPKQFLDILGVGQSLLQQTFKRFTQICPVENIYIVTNEIYIDTVAEQIPEMNSTQILGEPSRRNTAPCIAYTNAKIRTKNPKALIVTAPSDHLILNESKFIDDINKGLEFVKVSNSLLTLGIRPTRPETGYGYIQTDDIIPEGFNYINKVKSFTEKPDRETAIKFIDSGEFFWNSGIFIWSLKSIDKAFKKHLPEINQLFSRITKGLSREVELEKVKNCYAECQSISIDKGVMEHANNVFIYPTEFGWSDLGTWDSLYENSQKTENGNAVNTDNILCYDTTNCVINLPKNKLLVVEGLENYIIAESEDVLMICKRDNERRIRDFVNDVEEKKGEAFI
jgi:mannose-1-phosphate guanylyltransferase